jgi:hypothetical protein
MAEAIFSDFKNPWGRPELQIAEFPNLSHDLIGQENIVVDVPECISILVL